MPLAIRPATPSDIPAILRFVRELAAYEHASDSVVATEAQLSASLFGEDRVAHGLIALMDDVPVGYAIYFFTFSTWLGSPSLYLEDLYITPSSRGSGVGRAVLASLARIAVERNCGRMEWAVLDWNEPAIKFYRSLGALPQDEWTVYRLTGKTLTDVASKHSGEPR